MNFNIVNSLEKAKRAKEKRVNKAIDRCYDIIDLLLQKGYTEIELSYPLLFVKSTNSDKKLCTYEEWLCDVMPTIILNTDIDLYFDSKRKRSDINSEEYLILKLRGRL